MKNGQMFFKSITLDLIFAILSTMLAWYSIGFNNSWSVVWLVWAIAYPVGKILQGHVIGPRITRWYLADIGYIAWYPLMASAIYGVIESERSVKSAYYVAVFFLIAAIAAELLEMLLKIGGEWKDVVIFCTTFYFFCMLLGHLG